MRQAYGVFTFDGNLMGPAVAGRWPIKATINNVVGAIVHDCTMLVKKSNRMACYKNAK